MRIDFKTGLCAIVLATMPGRAEGSWPPPEVLRLADIALRNHPALASARLEADAAHALAKHHRAWEPPEVAVDFYNAPVSAFPNPLRRQEEIGYMVSQKIPFPGKLRTMAEPEHRRGAAAESRSAAAALDLRRKVIAAWAELYAAERRLALARESRDDVDALVRDARAGYSGGTGSASSALRAEREALRLDADVLRMEAMRREALAMLNALLGGNGGKDGNGAVSGSGVDSLAVPSVFHASSASRDAEGAAVSRRPDLEAMRGDRAMAEAEVAAARAELLPDFMVRGTYKDMRGNDAYGAALEDGWSVMLGMQVPFIPLAPWSLGGARQAQRRAQALRDKADRDVAAMELMANAEVETARAALESSLERAALARDKAAPLTERILASVRSEYAAGGADFSEVMEALREVREAREEYHRAAADGLKAWAELEYAVGGL